MLTIASAVLALAPLAALAAPYDHAVQTSDLMSSVGEQHILTSTLSRFSSSVNSLFSKSNCIHPLRAFGPTVRIVGPHAEASPSTALALHSHFVCLRISMMRFVLAHAVSHTAGGNFSFVVSRDADRLAFNYATVEGEMFLAWVHNLDLS